VWGTATSGGAFERKARARRKIVDDHYDVRGSCRGVWALVYFEKHCMRARGVHMAKMAMGAPQRTVIVIYRL
jgi:hypothetical protein